MLYLLTSVICVAQQPQSPVKVEVVNKNNSWMLLRNGQPYFVKGAGGQRNLQQLVACGGNSIRTWDTNNARAVLDSAQKYGLTVLMGLNVTAERHGFDYNDSSAVKKQLSLLKSEIRKYKNHPALLAWGIGNELNLDYKNARVWNAVNEIATVIHEEDPNHPATTVLAGLNKREVSYIMAACPQIDFLSVNTYAGLATLPSEIEASGWNKAYMVTEWGPTGHWECLQTDWHVPVEETSSEKAAVYKTRYEYSVEKDKRTCLGSYVFLWGQKQERTPTWYGLFTERNEISEVINVLQYLWSGNWPANKAPHIYSLQLNKLKANNNVYLKSGLDYPVSAIVSDPENDVLTYRWEVLPEPVTLSQGGDHEDSPVPLHDIFSKDDHRGNIIMHAPSKEGAYRIFIYATDGHNNVATANVPFYVNH